MNSKQSLKNLITKKSKIRAGEFYSINTKNAEGHKGELRNLKKNGTAVSVIVTHAKYTRGKKNIELCENPQPGDTRKAYLVPKLEKVKIRQIGKHHPDIKIKNKTDKSKVRNIVKRK